MSSQTSYGGRHVSLVSLILGILACGWISDTSNAFGDALLFLTASATMSASFVFVSRMKNRSSFRLYALASVFSNGTWYITWHLLQKEGLPLEYIILALFGALGGRTLTVKLAQRLESHFNLLADVKKRPEQIGDYLRAAKPVWFGLLIALVGYTLFMYETNRAMVVGIGIVAGLAFMQNFFYVQVSRLRERGKSNPNVIFPIVLLSTIAGISFFASFAYLGSVRMPLELFLPYIMVTVLGSTSGVLLSMKREFRLRVGADDHLESVKDYSEEPHAQSAMSKWFSAKPARIYKTLLLVGAAWMLFHTEIAEWLNLKLVPLTFPIPFDFLGEDWEPARIVIMCILVVVFFLNGIFFSLVSAAANRDHVWYHVATILGLSAFDFTKGLLILANATWDIIPIAMVATTLSDLYGRKLSGGIEKWLNARMDAQED